MIRGEPREQDLSHELTAAENERIFRQEILPRMFGKILRVDDPTVHLIGGQPGAGKSTIKGRIDAALTSLHGPGATMKIIGDDFRPYHPDYKRLLQLDDSLMPARTSPDSNRWVEKSIEYSLDLQPNVILEGTLRQPAVTISTANMYKERQFQTELHLVAVHEFTSRLRTFKRYFDRIELGLTSRYTRPGDHQRAYESLPESVDSILSSGSIGRVSLYDGNGNALGEGPAEGKKREIVQELTRVRGVLPETDSLLAELERYEQIAIDSGKLTALSDLRQLSSEIREATR